MTAPARPAVQASKKVTSPTKPHAKSAPATSKAARPPSKHNTAAPVTHLTASKRPSVPPALRAADAGAPAKRKSAGEVHVIKETPDDPIEDLAGSPPDFTPAAPAAARATPGLHQRHHEKQQTPAKRIAAAPTPAPVPRFPTIEKRRPARISPPAVRKSDASAAAAHTTRVAAVDDHVTAWQAEREQLAQQAAKLQGKLELQAADLAALQQERDKAVAQVEELRDNNAALQQQCDASSDQVRLTSPAQCRLPTAKLTGRSACMLAAPCVHTEPAVLAEMFRGGVQACKHKAALHQVQQHASRLEARLEKNISEAQSTGAAHARALAEAAEQAHVAEQREQAVSVQLRKCQQQQERDAAQHKQVVDEIDKSYHDVTASRVRNCVPWQWIHKHLLHLAASACMPSKSAVCLHQCSLL